MKLLRYVAAAAALPWFAGASFGQAELNRLDLHNGGDTLWFVNAVYVGSDPANGNFDGDLYWKIYPDHAIQTCSGSNTLWGVQMNLFDLDWSNFSPVWAYLITTTTSGSNLNLQPDLANALANPGVLVPQLDNSGLTSPSPGSCPKPGYVGGWIFSDLFADTGTGSLVPLMQASDPGSDDFFRTDGTVDWAFVHIYPGNNQSVNAGNGPQAVFAPSPNGCGSGFSGSATFQWLGSTDGTPPFGDGGENAGPMTLAPDGTGTGTLVPGTRSIYGGFQIGGAGGPAVPGIPEVQSGGADLNWLMEGATLALGVNTQYSVEGALGVEVGTAGLEFPIGWDTAPGGAGSLALKDGDFGTPGASNASLGVAMYNQSASTTSSFGVYSANVTTPFIDTIGCFTAAGADFGISVLDPIFNTLFNATIGAGVLFGGDPGNPGEVVYFGTQFDIGADPSLLGTFLAPTTLSFQAWELSLLSGSFVDSSAVARMNLRSNLNVQ